MVLLSKAQRLTVINNIIYAVNHLNASISQGATVIEWRELSKLHMDRAKRKKIEIVEATIYT